MRCQISLVGVFVSKLLLTPTSIEINKNNVCPFYPERSIITSPPFITAPVPTVLVICIFFFRTNSKWFFHLFTAFSCRTHQYERLVLNISQTHIVFYYIQMLLVPVQGRSQKKLSLGGWDSKPPFWLRPCTYLLNETT